MKVITSYTQKKQQESEIVSELMKPLNHNDRNNNFETEHGINLLCDHIGDGNSLFHEVAFQLGETMNHFVLM